MEARRTNPADAERAHGGNARTRATASARRGPRLAAAVFCVATLGLLSTAGCEEEPLRVRIGVDTNATVPDDINLVSVWLAASRNTNVRPELCVPLAREQRLNGPSDVPFYFDFLPGPEFNVFVVVRVEYYHDDGVTKRLVGLRDEVVRLPDSGKIERMLSLDRACLRAGCLEDPAQRQCIGEGDCRAETSLVNDADAAVVPDAPPCEMPDAGAGE